MIPEGIKTKAAIRSLLVEGNLPDAVAAGLQYAEYCNAVEATNQLTVLSGRLNQHIAVWHNGEISYEAFSQEQARIAAALTNQLQHLPEAPHPNAGKKHLLDETTFKNRLFILVVASKFIVLGRVWYLGSVGIFNMERFSYVFSLLIPAFIAYISLMIGDYIRVHKEQPAQRRYVSGPLINIAYILFPAYASLVWYMIQLGIGEAPLLSFTAMCGFLSGVEAVVGGYIGQVISGFFKKEA